MAEQTGQATDESTEVLAQLTPSAKLVAKTLEYKGDLTQSDLAESIRFATRTVRFALTQLEEAGIVSSRVSLLDARQRIYSLDQRRYRS